jgi:hypothetical protein
MIGADKSLQRDVDVWPPLPLIVGGDMDLSRTDNIIAALGQSNRVCKVDLFLAGWQLENILAAMQVPFPELTDLRFYISGESLPVIPDSFLGGSAPRLRYFELCAFHFRDCQNCFCLLRTLSTLISFHYSLFGYISPEAMVAVLSVLSSLEELSIEFQSFQSRPDWKAKSASTKTLYPPRSRRISFQRRYRIFRGPRDLHRRPSTRITWYNYLQSNRF